MVPPLWVSSEQVAAEPYETISFAIPAKEIVSEDSENVEDLNATWDHWDNDTKTFVFFPFSIWFFTSRQYFGLTEWDLRFIR